MKSIDGLHDHEHAHLSKKMRDKLAAERHAGQKAVGMAEEQQVYNAKAQERAREAARLEAEELAAARAQARQETAEKAQEQQAINAKANLEKEIQDAHEDTHGRHAPAHPAVVSMAADLVRQRTEQAKAAGLTPASGIAGTPEGSAEQAEAAQVNAEKEVRDRAEADNYAAAGVYQGHTEDAAVATHDEWGNPIGDGEANEGGENAEAATGGEFGVERQAENGQAAHVDEPTAADLMAGVGEPEQPKRRRGRPPAAQRAVGDGPSSE
ncbi:hypothetical protein PQI07_22540 [Methylobacterium sp. 092160098-2]|uniref:hypothetical protein n=1 Tax=Methylobacterium sp. 092160098-2 TaxID=3025129 RepID=UPI002381A45E|nr:hypothetical protein [Methylobacterium sp. 092160098-2]MDE4913462.1 hypothetical protein [Methylobacterium sp. 092160098-2]